MLTEAHEVTHHVASAKLSAEAQRGRAIPSFSIRLRNVLGLRPRSCAAPPPPSIRQRVVSSTVRMCRFSISTSVTPHAADDGSRRRHPGVAERERRARRQDDGALQDVLELADVAGPVVAPRASASRRQGCVSIRLLSARDRPPHQVLDEQRDVLAAIAQRRERDREHVEPIVQVAAEAALAHFLGQIAVGRGDDAHVDVHRARAAQPLELSFLQHAQQLGLQLERQLADFVEEERAAVGELEAADLGRVRAGERAALAAEQLALDQVGRQRGAVDDDQRTVRRGLRW